MRDIFATRSNLLHKALLLAVVHVKLEIHFLSCIHWLEMPRWEVQSWCSISVSCLPSRSIMHQWLTSNPSNRMWPWDLQSSRSGTLSGMSFGNIFWQRSIILLPMSCRTHMWWPLTVTCSLCINTILEQWWRGKNPTRANKYITLWQFANGFQRSNAICINLSEK